MTWWRCCDGFQCWSAWTGPMWLLPHIYCNITLWAVIFAFIFQMMVVYLLLSIRTFYFLCLHLWSHLFNLYFQLAILVSRQPSRWCFILRRDVSTTAAVRVFFLRTFHNLLLVWNLLHHVAANFKVEILRFHFNWHGIRALSKTLSFRCTYICILLLNLHNALLIIIYVLKLLMLFVFRQDYALSFELELDLGELCIELYNFLTFFGLGVSGAADVYLIITVVLTCISVTIVRIWRSRWVGVEGGCALGAFLLSVFIERVCLRLPRSWAS